MIVLWKIYPAPNRFLFFEVNLIRTMFCPRCGAEVRVSRDNCDQCGCPLHTREIIDDEVKSAPPLRCGNCDHLSPLGSTFCTYCGLPLGEPRQCPECHGTIRSLDRYCGKCGKVLRPERITRTSLRPLAALILAIVPGILSVWGIGHFFAGKVRRGLAFLALGLLMTVVAPPTLFFLVHDIGGLALMAVVGIVIWVAVWLFQSVDAYWEAGGE